MRSIPATGKPCPPSRHSTTAGTKTADAKQDGDDLITDEELALVEFSPVFDDYVVAAAKMIESVTSRHMDVRAAAVILSRDDTAVTEMARAHPETSVNLVELLKSAEDAFADMAEIMKTAGIRILVGLTRLQVSGELEQAEGGAA